MQKSTLRVVWIALTETHNYETDPGNGHLSHSSVQSCRMLQKEECRPHIARLCMCWCLMLIGLSPTYSASAVVRVRIDVIVHISMRIVHARLERLRNLQTFQRHHGPQVMRRR
jgi:hypothetical protein